ncbi:4Fe-4S dicluster domain-containing protein [Mailhella sp.]|uniref:4Fe-4S dicluster domain-containing protein n=1 Tax=Mailhella sp. TaxID=1981029 RepID=UPI003AB3E205
MPPIIHPEKCSHCGMCATICPMNIFTHAKGQTPVVAYPEECWHCNACVLDCPSKAIELRLPINYMMLHVDVDSLHGQKSS